MGRAGISMIMSFTSIAATLLGLAFGAPVLFFVATMLLAFAGLLVVALQ